MHPLVLQYLAFSSQPIIQLVATCCGIPLRRKGGSFCTSKSPPRITISISCLRKPVSPFPETTGVEERRLPHKVPYFPSMGKIPVWNLIQNRVQATGNALHSGPHLEFHAKEKRYVMSTLTHFLKLLIRALRAPRGFTCLQFDELSKRS